MRPPPPPSPSSGLPEPVALVVNPAAGPGWRRGRTRSVIAAARRHLPGLSVWPTGGPGDATRLAAQAAEKGMGTLLVAGGDGTIHEAIQGLAGTDTCLGPLPTGTANVLCREAGLPTSPLPALERLIAGRPRRVTLGRVATPDPATERWFVLMVGVGLDAAIVADVRGGPKYALGAGAYFLQGAATGLRYRYAPLTVKVHGETLTGTTAVIANARNYAGSFILAPEGGLDRPDLCLVLFDGRGPGSYLAHALGVMRGRHTARPGVTVRHGDRFEVSAVTSIAAQADGELVGGVPLTVSAVPGALLLLSPDGPAGA